MKYLTFPINILGFEPENICARMTDVMNYCLYDRSLSFEGSREEKIIQSAELLGIKFNNKEKAFKNGELIYNSIPVNAPKSSISIEMAFDFYKNEKTEFEIACFLAFAAIKSILQRQPYSRITNDYLLGRMAGNSKAGEPLNDFVFKYSNRYQLDKIKSELQRNWGLKMYCGKMRGFYVSFNVSIEQLIFYVETRKKKHKDSLLKQQISEAKEKVLHNIYNKEEQHL